MRNGNDPLAHAARPVTDFSLPPTRFLLNLLHRPRQYPGAIVQQSAVGRVVNIALHHGRVHPHLPSLVPVPPGVLSPAPPLDHATPAPSPDQSLVPNAPRF